MTRKTINTKLLVLILTIGVFGILNTEMGIVGVIPYVSEQFDVSVPDAGLLVSGFALVIAFAGPTMPLLFSKMNRKAVMLLALGVFSACNVISMFAPTFEVLLAARVIPAAFHPLYVSMAMAVAQQSGKTPEESAQASARVFMGVSAGMVVGAPIAGMLASAVSFTAAMGFFAVVTVAALIMTVALVPSMPVERPMSYGSQLAILKKPLLLTSILAAFSMNMALFGFYSYLADWLGGVGMGATLVSGVLLAYGLANIVGNSIAGRVLGRATNKTIVVMPFILVVLYVALFAVGTMPLAVAALTVVLGVAVGVANTANQFMVSRAAEEAPDFANGLFLTATNLGTTVGTTICGAFITAAGTSWSIIGALPGLALGVVFIVVRIWITRRNAGERSESRIDSTHATTPATANR